MTQKHQYIKQLHKEGDAIGLEKELLKIYSILEKNEKELANLLGKGKESNKINKLKKTIEDDNKCCLFIKRVKKLLYKKLEKGDENNNK